MKYFLYCRKSEDDESRQIMSIESQRTEMKRMAEQWDGVEIVDIYEEARTAKIPGRTVFGAMMKRIARGEAQGIVAWDPDRLARNSVDGGQIIYSIDRGVIKDLKFATYKFENSPQGKFMLGLMFSQSKYYVDALAMNVKRGMKTKAEKGTWPSKAPCGYLNDRNAKAIIPDPDRFELVQRMWRLLLNGMTVPAIQQVAAKEWGFRTHKAKKRGGTTLSPSGIYRMFTNPFYAGIYVWGGRTISGTHLAMITLAEFETAQRLLGRADAPRPQKHEFPLAGSIRCGECGCAITAEEKVKPSGRRYVYYRCTRRRASHPCQENAVSEMDLEKQVMAFLAEIVIPPRFVEWAKKQLAADGAQTAANVSAARLSITRSVAANNRSRANLLKLRLADQLTDEEFSEERQRLEMESARLTQEHAALDQPQGWFGPAEKLVLFSSRAVEWFAVGDARTKQLILRAAGSDPRLKAKILNVQARKPLIRREETDQIHVGWALLNEVRTLVESNDPGMMEMDALITEITALQATGEPLSGAAAAA